MSLGPTNGEVFGALNQGDAPADALDKFLVAAAFDWAKRRTQISPSVRMLKLRGEVGPGDLEERIHWRAW